MPPRRLIERRDAHEPMHAGFGQQHPVGVVADDGERRALDAGFVAGLDVDDFALEAAALRPSQVHAQEHLGPVLRLGAAGAGMDGDDRVLAIVLAAEHLLGLAGVDFRRQIVEAAREIVGDRLARLRPLDQHAEILGAASQRLAEIADPLRAVVAAGAASARRPGPSRSRDPRRAASILESSSAGRAASKIAPQVGGAACQILIPAKLLVQLKGHMKADRLKVEDRLLIVGRRPRGEERERR